MPHTSRKKRPAGPGQKRLQVTDDDGWTHVTSSNNVRRVLRGTRARTNEQDSQSKPQAQAQDPSKANVGNEAELVLSPAEAPGRLTLEELQAQYHGYREKWVSSETWTQLERQLGERIADRGEICDAGSGSESSSAPFDAIVCVGLGSPSGFLRGGWVDRRSVSMYQLAALESIAQRVSGSYPFPLNAFPFILNQFKPAQSQTPQSPSTPKTPSSIPSTNPSSKPSA